MSGRAWAVPGPRGGGWAFPLVRVAPGFDRLGDHQRPTTGSSRAGSPRAGSPRVGSCGVCCWCGGVSVRFSLDLFSCKAPGPSSGVLVLLRVPAGAHRGDSPGGSSQFQCQLLHGDVHVGCKFNIPCTPGCWRGDCCSGCCRGDRRDDQKPCHGVARGHRSSARLEGGNAARASGSISKTCFLCVALHIVKQSIDGRVLVIA